MPKYKKQEFTEDGRPIRKSDYTEDRDCYMDEHGNYVYTTWVMENKRWVRKVLATIPFEEMHGETSWTIVLDDIDCDQDRSDDRYRKLVDPEFRARQASYSAGETDANGDEYSDPLDEVAYALQRGTDPAAILTDEPEPESPKDAQVDAVMDKLTKAQRDLIFDHVGMGKKLEDIRREEEERTGKTVTQQAVSNRWKKIKNRFGRELGMEVPNVRKGKDADEDED